MGALNLLKMWRGHNLKVHTLLRMLCVLLHMNLVNVCVCCVFVGEVLSKLISSVEESGAKYAVLYVSDPARSIRYPSYRELQRFLEEGAESTNSTACDKVCHLKSSLLEGIFVVSFFVHFLKCGSSMTCNALFLIPFFFDDV